MTPIRKAILTFATAAPLVLGMIAVFGAPSSAQQMTVTCWKTVCVQNPETKEISCMSHTIPCPPEETEIVHP
ncbi:hypothetical protein [Longimicrobium terrae]|uniref:Uncharacterized protein n=1 Tax=Longimicrobium terrae TaxID=1639882 RepID=A0A841H6P4_9BACT|nr:hypothetical protein [Longimicrobium terrae]MBB4639276.1 hypothetical protein [Longimicrobium terrae]MBB6073516.1 hypothetical protein [Longimicrobium terrae]NNC32234.1 hypothetical protein [Longimicrobium terrae]